MGIIGIDIGSSTTKIIFYKDNKIVFKKIYRDKYSKDNFYDFISVFNINKEEIEKIVFTGIGADKINKDDYNSYEIFFVEEFDAIANGGLYLSKKEEAIVVSVGTGTALIKVSKEGTKHLGGTGVGAGTLFNLCRKFLGTNSYDDILNLAKKGDITKVDLRIGDVTDKEIVTLPKDLTLANFGKMSVRAYDEDIAIGIINMIFEVIGMMVAFASINSDIKEAVLIGNIVDLPGVKEILKKIEFTHNVKFVIVDNVEYAVALGAIIKILK